MVSPHDTESGFYSCYFIVPKKDGGLRSILNLMALFHCMVRYGSARLGTVRYGTAQFGSVAFPPQFSTAIEWAGLFTRRYNCAASTAVTSS